MVDEDETVKDLAIKTIEELWFPVILASALKSQKGVTTNQDKSLLLSKVAVIMGTSAKFSDRQSPLEDILHQIIAEKQGNEAAALHARYTEICEALIDGLVDASDLPGFVSSTRDSSFVSNPRIDRHQLHSDHLSFYSLVPGHIIWFQRVHSFTLPQEAD
jgi:hypothetical protein